ncbi:hypothetical protein Kim5_CH02491 [Rhizobium sp. Kim5]|nr:hypothetical protein Kim5_CH02491 [Rhizobium sp. Kim5]
MAFFRCPLSMQWISAPVFCSARKLQCGSLPQGFDAAVHKNFVDAMQRFDSERVAVTEGAG